MSYSGKVTVGTGAAALRGRVAKQPPLVLTPALTPKFADEKYVTPVHQSYTGLGASWDVIGITGVSGGGTAQTQGGSEEKQIGMN